MDIATNQQPVRPFCVATSPHCAEVSKYSFDWDKQRSHSHAMPLRLVLSLLLWRETKETRETKWSHGYDIPAGTGSKRAFLGRGSRGKRIHCISVSIYRKKRHVTKGIRNLPMDRSVLHNTDEPFRLFRSQILASDRFDLASKDIRNDGDHVAIISSP